LIENLKLEQLIYFNLNSEIKKMLFYPCSSDLIAGLFRFFSDERKLISHHSSTFYIDL